MKRTLAAFALLALGAGLALADATPQTLPYFQDWTDTGLITANDDWSGVPGVVGFQGQDPSTSSAPYDPQTYLVVDTNVDVIANQANPNTLTTGGVAEFHITDPVVALQGSGTADAPHVTIALDTTGEVNVTVQALLRDVDGSADNAIQPISLQYRVGGTGLFTDFPGAFVADASSGPNEATLETPLCAVLPVSTENQALVEVRFVTGNAVGSDEWIGVDDILVDTAGCAGGGFPVLTIADVSVLEGDVGTVDAVFTVALSGPAGVGGVTFDIATQDDTATVADDDYEANVLPDQVIPEGDDEYTFTVTVNGDFDPEPTERFVVDVTDIGGATIGDASAFGTITTDEVALTPIHDIQGPGASSPIPGAVVNARGVVTAVKSNGFFFQAPDAEVDADPLTSEGILVFTSSAPPAAAAVGNLVQVTGTVAEFVPSADPLQPPLTELTSPTVALIAAGQPLPAAVALSPTFPDPAGVHDQLERHEGMRVSVASFTVWGPTLGGVNEPNATATSNGVLYGTVTGHARPRREAGIQAPDPPPQGSIPPIPRFDFNPESIRVDSDSAGHAPLDVGAGAVLTGLIGPLDFAFRKHTIALEAAAVVTPQGGPTPTAVAAPTAVELTVAAYNLHRFFDDVDDPGIGEPVLTAVAYASRLARASLGIRDYLELPDVIGVVEAEKLDVLQDLADQIAADAGPLDPQYAPYLVEGNDVGGIDVGFLVKTAPVSGTVPRVEVTEVVQERAGTLFVNPDASTELLNDRPTLRLTGVVNFANGQSQPLTVMVNHLRSLNGVASLAPGSDGWPTVGERVRAKRLAQAEDLADLVQDRQLADPAEVALLIGDFNAFEFNDGLVHSLGVIAGAPVPDEETAVPGDGVDLVTPDLERLGEPGDYSYVFDGNAQSLDHALANAPLVGSAAALRLEHPRINADFPEVARNAPGTVERLSDHDPLVVFLRPASLDPDLAFRGDFESGDTRWWSFELP